MATFAFSVGRKGTDSVQLTASIPALSTLADDAPIPFQVKLPDGKVCSGKIDSKRELVLASLAIQLQHATRDLVFPDTSISQDGGKRRKARYEE